MDKSFVHFYAHIGHETEQGYFYGNHEPCVSEISKKILENKGHLDEDGGCWSQTPKSTTEKTRKYIAACANDIKIKLLEKSIHKGSCRLDGGWTFAAVKILISNSWNNH